MTTGEMDTAHNQADDPQRRSFQMTSRSSNFTHYPDSSGIPDFNKIRCCWRKMAQTWIKDRVRGKWNISHQKLNTFVVMAVLPTITISSTLQLEKWKQDDYSLDIKLDVQGLMHASSRGDVRMKSAKYQY